MTTTDSPIRLGAADIHALALQAQQDNRLLQQLFATTLSGQGREARYAAWTLTHLPPSTNPAIAAHRDPLVTLALTTPDSSLLRLTLNLLARLTWQTDNIRTDLLDFCLAAIPNPRQPYGVRALCIKLAWQQCRHYPELAAELRQTLLLLDPADLKPGLKHTWAQTLRLIPTP